MRPNRAHAAVPLHRLGAGRANLVICGIAPPKKRKSFLPFHGQRTGRMPNLRRTLCPREHFCQEKTFALLAGICSGQRPQRLNGFIVNHKASKGAIKIAIEATFQRRKRRRQPLKLTAPFLIHAPVSKGSRRPACAPSAGASPRERGRQGLRRSARCPHRFGPLRQPLRGRYPSSCDGEWPPAPNRARFP